MTMGEKDASKTKKAQKEEVMSVSTKTRTDRTTLCIKKSTYDLLAEYKPQWATWDEFLIMLLGERIKKLHGE